MKEKRCYTAKEIQEILDVSMPTVYAILKRHEFQWIRLDSGAYRISKKSFDAWLDGTVEEEMAENKEISEEALKTVLRLVEQSTR